MTETVIIFDPNTSASRQLELREAYQRKLATYTRCQYIADVIESLLYDDIDRLKIILEPHEPIERKAILTSKDLRYPAIYYARTPQMLSCVLQYLDKHDRLNVLFTPAEMKTHPRRSFHHGALPVCAAFMHSNVLRAEQRFLLVLTMIENLTAEQRLNILQRQKFSGAWLQYLLYLCYGDSDMDRHICSNQFNLIMDTLDTEMKLRLLVGQPKESQLNSPLLESLTLHPPHHELFWLIVRSFPKTEKLLLLQALTSEKFELKVFSAPTSSKPLCSIKTTLLHLAIDHLGYDEDHKSFCIIRHTYQNTQYDCLSRSLGPAARLKKLLINRSQLVEDQGFEATKVAFQDTPLCCILEGVTLEQCRAMFEVLDDWGNTPLHYIHHGHVLMQILQTLNPEQQSMLGMLLLENFDEQPVISKLAQLPGFADIVEHAFLGLSYEEKVKVLRSKDKHGVTVLECALETQSSFQAVLNSFHSIHEQQTLLKLPLYEYDRNLLHHLIDTLKEVAEASTFLSDVMFVDYRAPIYGEAEDYKSNRHISWLDTKLCKLLSCVTKPQRLDLLTAVDRLGDSAVHQVSSMPAFVLILEMLDEQQRKTLLLLRDPMGCTPLHKIFGQMKFFVGGRVTSSSDHMKNANLRVDELIICIGLDKFVDILMVQDDTGQTPLHLTAVNSNGAFLLKQLLRPLKGHIKLCAILNVRTSSGSTVLHTAVERLLDWSDWADWHSHMVKEVMHKVQIIMDSVPDSDRATMLMAKDRKGNAIMHKNIYTVEGLTIELLKLVPREGLVELLKVKREDGHSPMHIMAGNHKCFAALRQVTGMVPEQERLELFKVQNCLGLTPIHLTAGSLPIVLKHFLGRLPNKQACYQILCTKSTDGMTALHKALAVDCMESIHFMLESCGICRLLQIIAPCLVDIDTEFYDTAAAALDLDGWCNWLERIDTLSRVDAVRIILCWNSAVPTQLLDVVKSQNHQWIEEKVKTLKHSRVIDLRGSEFSLGKSINFIQIFV